MTSTESARTVKSFQTPSSAALHLNAAWKAARRAAACRAAIKWVESPTVFASWGFGSTKAMRQVHEDATSTLFDYLEDAMVAATASFSAIEAFCNATIVERQSGAIDLERRGETRSMSAEEIEEQASTEEKLKRIVPCLLGTSSPAGDSKLWQPFRRLKALRDSVTHFKRRDLSKKDSEPTALHELVEIDPFEHPECAAAIIRHFHGEVPPRWLLNPAWSRTGPLKSPD